MSEHEYLVCYVRQGRDPSVGEKVELTAFDGQRVVGTAVITGMWKTPRSWLSDRRYSMRATLEDGSVFNLRGGGPALAATGKRAKPVKVKV